MKRAPSVCRQEAGIALVLVLWVLTLLTVMAVGLTAAQRTETALSDNHVSAARFRAAADAAVAFTVLVFAMAPPDSAEPNAPADASETDDSETIDRSPRANAFPGAETSGLATWLPNGATHPWRFGGLDLRIRVFNEASRIDLNQAQPTELSALLVALGVEEEQATALAAAIVDWRDDDDISLLNGAEDDDYLDAGRSIGAKDGPYVEVAELMQVMGMTPEIYRALAAEVSVEIEGGEFDDRFASAAGLAAMQGIPLEDARTLISERDSPLFEDGSGPRYVDRGGPLYRIEVSETAEGGRIGRRMEASIETMPGQQPPYLVRWRRFGLPTDPVQIPTDENAI